MVLNSFSRNTTQWLSYCGICGNFAIKTKKSILNGHNDM